MSFFHNWFSNGLLLVNQLLNNEGNLFTFADFFSRYKITITLKEVMVLTRAIPAGVCCSKAVYIHPHFLSVLLDLNIPQSALSVYKTRSLFLRLMLFSSGTISLIM